MRHHNLSIIDDNVTDETPVNLTPLIDVVFVVLILFILVAPLVEIDRIHLANAPAAKQENVLPFQENSPVNIHVHEDNTIWLNGTPLAAEDLPYILKRTYQAHPHACPQLYHDKNAYFGTYQSVKNAVEFAGFSSLDIILKSE